MAVVGQREAEAGTVAVRVRGAGKKQEVMPVDAFMARVVGDSARGRAVAAPERRRGRPSAVAAGSAMSARGGRPASIFAVTFPHLDAP